MKKREPLFSVEKAEHSTGFLLWQVTSLWQRTLNNLLKKYDLTHAQFVVLATLAWLSQTQSSINQIDIASLAKMDPMFVSNLLKILQKKRLISRKTSRMDTRAKEVTITPEGLEIIRPALKDVEGFDKIFFSKLGSQVPMFNELLLKLISENTK